MLDDRDKATSRRQFFRSLGGHGALRRPPWSVSDFTDQCTRCNACVERCPEGVLFQGGGGFPEIRFDDAGCSLCGECVEACESHAFEVNGDPFPWRAEVQPGCLALERIHCQACQDACEWRAIRFPPEPGRPPRPHIDTAACTGCGACQAICPSDAIRMVARESLAAEMPHA